MRTCHSFIRKTTDAATADCLLNKYKCFLHSPFLSKYEWTKNIFFSSVLETNTINKAERKREGLVYITRLQKNFSAPTAKVVWLFSRCLFMWKDLGQNHSPLPEDTYPFPLKEKTNLWELETAKKDMFWSDPFTQRQYQLTPGFTVWWTVRKYSLTQQL